MRKFLCLFVLLILLLTSCNTYSCGNKKETQLNNLAYGDIDFYICGLYLQVEDFGSFDLNDANPKIYFNFIDGDKYYGFINTETGYGSSAASFNETQRTVNDMGSYTLYDATAYLNLVNESYKSITLYQIRLVKGEYEVLSSVSETINISKNGKYQFVNSFTKNKNKFKIQIELQY